MPTTLVLLVCGGSGHGCTALSKAVMEKLEQEMPDTKVLFLSARYLAYAMYDACGFEQGERTTQDICTDPASKWTNCPDNNADDPNWYAAACSVDLAVRMGKDQTLPARGIEAKIQSAAAALASTDRQVVIVDDVSWVDDVEYLSKKFSCLTVRLPLKLAASTSTNYLKYKYQHPNSVCEAKSAADFDLCFTDHGSPDSMAKNVMNKIKLKK